jgi:hypothetical protein
VQIKHDIAVRAKAFEMINRFADRAADEATFEVTSKIDGALAMDQVRRAIVEIAGVGKSQNGKFRRTATRAG